MNVGLARYALPLITIGGIASFMLNPSLHSWWCAVIPAFMLIARAIIDEVHGLFRTH